MRNPFRIISEMIVPTWSNGGLRSAFRVINGAFFPTQPFYDKTVVNYDKARQLYRNDGDDLNFGAGFCRPIIDRCVEFMDIPRISVDDDALAKELNDTVEKHWKPELVQIFRNAMRDSKTIVRVWAPLLDDPLATEDERTALCLRLYEPERVDLIYDPRNPNFISKAVIRQMVEWPDDDTSPVVDPPRGARPQVKEHEIWEVITPERYTYYDRTDRAWLSSWAQDNPYGFVPLLEVWNEYDSALSGGQSDLEPVVPFISAFHEVVRQVLQSHKYHSMPKLKFKVADIANFLKNNFPEVIDDSGAIIPGSAISWRGREILFLGEEDDIGFIEADSVLGDSKELLNFLIDCISIVSETPEELFMRSEQGASATNDRKIIAFEKKIERKRTNFQPYIQTLLKMKMVINGDTPQRAQIVWDEIRSESIVTMAQAMQAVVMAYEVLLARQLISDNTAREGLRNFRIFKFMKSPDEEAKDALKNFEPPIPIDPNAQIKATANGGSSNGKTGGSKASGKVTSKGN